jgi:hypothetical protein
VVKVLLFDSNGKAPFTGGDATDLAAGTYNYTVTN